MNCKQCGAQLRKEHIRADGMLECPDCKKLYRIKASTPAAAPKKAPARSGGKGRKSRKKGGLPVSPRLLAVIGAAIVIIAVLLIVLVPGGADRVVEPIATPTVEPTPVPTPTPEPTPEPIQPASARIRAVGDVMSHKLQLRHAKQDDGTYSYDAQFQYVKDSLQRADLTIANLELSIAVDDEYSSYPLFRSPEAILATLKDCGVDLLTVANNHILDGFWDGLVHTLDKCDEYGFDHVGADRTPEESIQPLIRDVNGIKFGFLAYTKAVNGNDARLKDGQTKYCIKYLDKADFKRDVQELRDLGAEVVVCLPHWGNEGSRKVSNECKEYAQKMIDAGVDIILGSHPHVVLPIDVGETEVNGEKKDVLVAWSMGNFISYMAAQYMDSGIIVDFTVNRDETGKITISDVGYVPVYVWGNTNRFHLVCSGDFYNDKPEKMSNDTHKRMKQSVKEISNMIGEDSGIEMLQN